MMEIDAYHELNKAIKASGRKKEASVWFSSWPNIRELAMRLTEYIPMCVPDVETGRPLLVRCIEEAFDAINMDWLNPENEKKFISGLMKPTPSILNLRIGITHNGCFTPWNPAIESLMKFINSQPGDLTIIEEPFFDMPPYEVRMILASRIMDMIDINRIGIKNVICEQDI
ncbi:MAG: hypothetical protein KGI54_04825 [Pseudomonadota bacterium]|nr:hypothetical protein [Pseudomonadota bacterium]